MKPEPELVEALRKFLHVDSKGLDLQFVWDEFLAWNIISEKKWQSYENLWSEKTSRAIIDIVLTDANADDYQAFLDILRKKIPSDRLQALESATFFDAPETTDNADQQLSRNLTSNQSLEVSASDRLLATENLRRTFQKTVTASKQHSLDVAVQKQKQKQRFKMKESNVEMMEMDISKLAKYLEKLRRNEGIVFTDEESDSLRTLLGNSLSQFCTQKVAADQKQNSIKWRQLHISRSSHTVLLLQATYCMQYDSRLPKTLFTEEGFHQVANSFGQEALEKIFGDYPEFQPPNYHPAIEHSSTSEETSKNGLKRFCLKCADTVRSKLKKK